MEGSDGDEPWRCRKHPAAQPPTGGVCPSCLRARLLRLCPDCAGEKPRGCTCPFAPSSTSLSFSAFRDVPGSGRASHLNGGEPTFRRSGSAAPRPAEGRSDEPAAAAPPQVRGIGGGLSWLWPFARAKKEDKEKAKNLPPAPSPGTVPATRLPRSRSAGVVTPGGYPPGQGAARGGGSASWKAWSRYLPIPMRSFRRTSRVVQARSPSAVAAEILELHP